MSTILVTQLNSFELHQVTCHVTRGQDSVTVRCSGTSVFERSTHRTSMMTDVVTAVHAINTWTLFPSRVLVSANFLRRPCHSLIPSDR